MGRAQGARPRVYAAASRAEVTSERAIRGLQAARFACMLWSVYWAATFAAEGNWVLSACMLWLAYYAGRRFINRATP